MKRLIYFLIIMLFYSCQNDNNKSQNSFLKSKQDTTKLFNESRIEDSTYYKSFVRSNIEKLIEKNWRTNQVDSAFSQTISNAREYQAIQKFVDVEFSNNENDIGQELTFIRVENISKKIINGVRIKVTYYNAFQEYLGEKELQITNSLTPGEIFERVFSPIINQRSLYSENKTLYAISSVNKITYSNSEDLGSKLNGEIIDFEYYNFPTYLGLNSQNEAHELNRPNNYW